MRSRFKVHTAKVHEGGPMHGEPMAAPGGSPRPVVARAGAWPMPHSAIARARALGEPEPSWARKFLVLAGEQEGQVPGEPTAEPDLLGSSVLPMVAASRQVPDSSDEWGYLVQNGEVIPAPYDPWLLVCAVEESDALPPNIEAMATNIGGYGVELEALFPREDPETGETIKPPPGAEDERGRLELFLAAACPELGLAGLQYQVDHDLESTGNGYVEVLRDADGQPAAFEHAPAFTMRLGRLSKPILVEQPFRHPVTGEIVALPRWRRFRTFVQIREGQATYFKQFGDPRFINRRTGLYRTTSWGKDEHGNLMDGTEIRHFRIYCAHSPYGVPRWIGALPQVRCGRQAGELLVDWFDNAPIGAKIAAVAGGVWKDGSLDSAIARIDEMARGTANAWSLIGLEAETVSADPLDDTRDAPPRITIEDLAYQLQPDLYKGDESLIGQADARVRAMFRLPAVYLGRSQDFSRASSATARGTAEEQVFVPIRSMRWEVWFDNELLPSLGVKFWRIRLLGANTTDDGDLPLGELVQGGGASPNALLRVFAEQTGIERPQIAEPWGDRPLALTMALMAAGLDPNKPLGELAEEVKVKEEEAAAAAAEALEAAQAAGGDGAPAPGGRKPPPGARGGPPGAKPGQRPPPPPPGRQAAAKAAGEAMDLVGQLVGLRAALVAQVRAEDLQADPGMR